MRKRRGVGLPKRPNAESERDNTYDDAERMSDNITDFHAKFTCHGNLRQRKLCLPNVYAAASEALSTPSLLVKNDLVIRKGFNFHERM